MSLSSDGAILYVMEVTQSPNGQVQSYLLCIHLSLSIQQQIPLKFSSIIPIPRDKNNILVIESGTNIKKLGINTYTTKEITEFDSHIKSIEVCSDKYIFVCNYNSQITRIKMNGSDPVAKQFDGDIRHMKVVKVDELDWLMVGGSKGLWMVSIDGFKDEDLNMSKYSQFYKHNIRFIIHLDKHSLLLVVSDKSLISLTKLDCY